MGDGGVRESVGEQQHDLGPHHEAGGQRLGAGDVVEIQLFMFLQQNRVTFKGHTYKTFHP